MTACTVSIVAGHMLDAQNCIKERKVFTLCNTCVKSDGWGPSVFWSVLHKMFLFPAKLK